MHPGPLLEPEKVAYVMVFEVIFFYVFFSSTIARGQYFDVGCPESCRLAGVGQGWRKKVTTVLLMPRAVVAQL